MFDWDADQARKRIGHIKDAETFESTYKHIVKKKEAVKWFQILPPDIEKQRQEAAKKQKEFEDWQDDLSGYGPLKPKTVTKDNF